MANTLLTPTMIARKSLAHLINNLVFAKMVYRDYEKEFKKNGETLTIRLPNKFTAVKGATRSEQTISEPSTVMTVATQAHVSFAFPSIELTHSVEDYEYRYLRPAMIALADVVDTDLASLYKDVYNLKGTPGITPNAFSNLSDCCQLLDECIAPKDMRRAALNPAASWSLANALKGTFDKDVASSTIKKGHLGRIANLEINNTQNVQRHTTGTHTTGSTPLVNGASQTGASLITNGWAASTAVIKQGDVFTLAGVNSVNPVNGSDLGYLQQFVATADGTSDGSGDLTLTISPKITTSGAYKTVTASPVNGAAITMVGTEATAYPQNLLFHPEAFALIVAQVAMPAGAVFKARSTFQGISLRVIHAYDHDKDEDVCRVDIIYGVKTIRPSFAVRMVG